jgi:penicillin-binding protein 1B
MHDNQQNFFQKLFGVGGHNETVSPYTPPPASPTNVAVPLPAHPSAAKPANNAPSQEQTAQPEEPKKKRNFFQKLFGGGGDKNKKDKGQEPPQ